MHRPFRRAGADDADLGSIVATIVAALAETLPIELDDNITVPATAAATLWFAKHLDWASGLEGLRPTS